SVVRTVSERARLVRLAQTRAADFLLQPQLKHWWNRYFVNSSRLGNADVQAQGTLLRLCLLHWLAQTRQHRTHDQGRQLYTAAVAFRWEKQARCVLSRWMQASSNAGIRVRLALRLEEGPDRQAQLLAAADRWAEMQGKRRALRRLARTARIQRMHRDISMRFAAAWGNANIQRQALATWRTRISPSSSMFFSVAG
ncbi:hypothetical protein IWW55_006299, partial [Coemansia sp. RSA 2706]